MAKLKMRRWKSMRQESAEKRQEERAKRSPKEQLVRLDNMFGKGEGAQKERKRLQEMIDKEKQSGKKKKKENKLKVGQSVVLDLGQIGPGELYIKQPY